MLLFSRFSILGIVEIKMQNIKKNLIRVLPLIIAIPLLFESPAAASPRDAVVKIFVTKNQMDYYRPWQAKGSSSTSGSGCVISGNRILTNAHVVSDSTFIQVRKESNPQKYTAQLEAVGNDCDLAILTVKDPTFFEGIAPLSLGDLPQLQDAVSVIGFPLGGDKLSITEGVVSRIEIITYVQSAKKLLGVQIDAAINPGNSGGPVFLNGEVVGIAMQVISNGQNIGYMIPTPIIRHFLSDLEDGRYDGFPTLGVEFHNTENKTLREYYNVEDNAGGVLISNVLPYSAADDILQEGDIMLSVNGVPIGMDGTFEFRPNERLGLSYLINSQQVGEKVSLEIFRKGKRKTVEAAFDTFEGLVPAPQHFEKPPYYIFGGMIFTVLSSDLLQSWGNNWWEKAPLDFLHYLIGKGRLNEAHMKEVVVMLGVLPDDINAGYHGFNNLIIQKVNGRTFKSFKEFVLLLEKNRQEYTYIETDEHYSIILKTSEIAVADKGILERNNIPYPYSKDVATWLEGEKQP
jgi:S1-C subfamily serine protease